MELCVPSSVLNQLHNELVQDDGVERFAYLYAGRTGDGELLAADVHVVDDADLREQSGAAVRPKLAVERRHVQQCLNQGLVPVLVHSHPFTSRAGFSGTDVATIDTYREWLTNLRNEEFPFGFAVIAQEDVKTTGYDPDRKGMVDIPVEVVGRWQLTGDLAGITVDDHSNGGAVDRDRFDRNIRAVSEPGQRRIRDTHVAVVGCGGIGSVLVEQLARLGVGELTLVDPDHVEESNLPRLVGAYPEHTGRAKVDVLEQHVWRVAPTATTHTHQQPVQQVADAVAAADIVMTGVDTVAARSVVNEACVRRITPWIDTGVIIETQDDDHGVAAMRGSIQTIAPGVTACYHCSGRFDPEQARIDRLDDEELEHEIEDGYVDADIQTPQPAVIHLNTVVAGVAVHEFTKLVTGFDTPRGLVQVDALSYDIRPMTTTAAGENCPVCSPRSGVLGRGPANPDEIVDDPADRDTIPTTTVQ